MDIQPVCLMFPLVAFRAALPPNTTAELWDLHTEAIRAGGKPLLCHPGDEAEQLREIVCQNKSSGWSSALKDEPMRAALCTLLSLGKGLFFSLLKISGPLQTYSRNWLSCVWLVLLRVNGLIGFQRLEIAMQVMVECFLVCSPRIWVADWANSLKLSSLLLKIICLHGTNSEFEPNFNSCISGEVTTSNEFSSANVPDHVYLVACFRKGLIQLRILSSVS